jgi:hypothetical protein
VQSIFDGAYDQVNWNPEIHYLDVEPLLDANNLDVYHYNAVDDFTLAGFRNLFLTVPMAGTVRITGELHKEMTSDDVTLLILKNDQPVYSENLTWDQEEIITLSQDIEVTAQDNLMVKLAIDSPVDLTQLQWADDKPLQLFYLSSPEQENLVDEQGQPTFQIDLSCDYDVYPESYLAQPLTAWQAPATGTYTIQSLLAIPQVPSILPDELKDELISGDIIMTVKRANELLGKHTIKVNEDVVTNESFTIEANEGDLLYFEFSSREPGILAKLSQVTAGITAPDGNDIFIAGRFSWGESSDFGRTSLPWLECICL